MRNCCQRNGPRTRRCIRRPRKPGHARLAPPESPTTPNPTTRILSHPGRVWLTLRSHARRGVRLSLSVRPANPSSIPVFHRDVDRIGVMATKFVCYRHRRVQSVRWFASGGSGLQFGISQGPVRVLKEFWIGSGPAEQSDGPLHFGLRTAHLTANGPL